MLISSSHLLSRPGPRPGPLSRLGYAKQLVHLTACLLLAAGCTGGNVDPATQAAASDGAIDPSLLQPLTALGPCGDPPVAAPGGEEVEGLVLPPGAVVTSVTRTDPIVTVEGWVPLTPIQLRVDYADRGQVEVLTVEDEVWEAEILATADGRRLFVKAQAVCEAASLFVAVIAPDDAADAVPVPAGGG